MNSPSYGTAANKLAYFCSALAGFYLTLGRIMFRHVFPNTLAPLIVAATLDVGWFIMARRRSQLSGLGSATANG